MSKTLTAILVIITLASFGTAAYLFGARNTNNNGAQEKSTSLGETKPPQNETGTTNPTTTAEQGTVTGKLCYPSEMIPAGKIVAKNTVTKEILIQEYPGTEAGAKSTYTFELPTGTYHIKLELPQMSGYYNECAKNPAFDVCSQDINHKLIDIKVVANQTSSNVDLCDFYGTEDQKQKMELEF